MKPASWPNRVTDAEGNATSYTYGDRDLMTVQVSPVSGTTSYAYNEHGELTSEIDARGVVMARTVDALDRVTAVTYPDPGLGIAYTYDDPLVPFAKGRLTRIARNGTNVDYRYDRFGRLLQDGPEAARVAVILAEAFPNRVDDQRAAAEALCAAGRPDAAVYRRRALAMPQ